MISIGVFGAFVAGILSLISPCSALLVPAFFAYAFASVRQLVTKTFVFFLGLCATLVPLGTGAGGLGQIFTMHRETVILVGGWIIIALGIYAFFGGGFQVPGLARLNSRVRGQGYLAVFALGAVYGFAGFCAGPLLGAVLTTAAVSGSAVYGALIMAVYAAGMAVPLFVLALFWDRFDLGSKSWLRGREVRLGRFTTNTLSMISGALFVLIGVLFITSHGTGALPTLLDADAQYSIQTWAYNASKQISDAWVWFGVSLAATVTVGVKAARTRV
ncbi:cytochrome c biogenesis CcdA family protein [Corynebacterium breve]|uniref:Cytochrome c biogenesis CcdA family protein n=1 Tax=Corynebacterium breve TaxID=3049799 RepID=A0ABY8VFF8_9CORY|nr:cytochrome c biogenesis CcdA family protein [Corynebacterium breve]WIM68234.1 cytochrome c biogenesis CcdA family protein [Corynebacterium breve]